jgi:hypothetical protein
MASFHCLCRTACVARTHRQGLARQFGACSGVQLCCSPTNRSCSLPLPQPTFGYIMPEYPLGSVGTLLAKICHR